MLFESLFLIIIGFLDFATLFSKKNRFSRKNGNSVYQQNKATSAPKTTEFYNGFSKDEEMTAEFMAEEVNLNFREAMTFELVFGYA